MKPKNVYSVKMANDGWTKPQEVFVVATSPESALNLVRTYLREEHHDTHTPWKLMTMFTLMEISVIEEDL